MATDIARPRSLLETYDDEQIAALETALGDGDLSKLDQRGRLAWYEMRCRAAGLDPLTMPFQWLRTPATERRPATTVLYAKPEAANQLAQKHRLSIEFLRWDMLGDNVLRVECLVTGPDGRRTTNVGCRSVKGLYGQDLANAHMACHTIAMRRTVFSHCGLGDQDGPPGSSVVDLETGEVLEESPALPAPTPYADTVMATAAPAPPAPIYPSTPAAPVCEVCAQVLTKAQIELSTRAFGKQLCPRCQRSAPRLGDENPRAGEDAAEAEYRRRMAQVHAMWHELYPGTPDDALRARLSEITGRLVESRTTLTLAELQMATAELEAEKRDRAAVEGIQG